MAMCIVTSAWMPRVVDHHPSILCFGHRAEQRSVRVVGYQDRPCFKRSYLAANRTAVTVVTGLIWHGGLQVLAPAYLCFPILTRLQFLRIFHFHFSNNKATAFHQLSR